MSKDTAKEDTSFEGSLPGRPAEERTEAVEAVRRFCGEGGGEIEYQATFLNPYFDDGSLIEVYATGNGYECWVDPANDLLVQVGPYIGNGEAEHAPRAAERKPVSELRALAVKTIRAHCPNFAVRQSSLYPLEDNRQKKIYFFRWDDFSGPVKDGELPPFVQTGIWADGKIASYTNTLRRS